MAKRKTKNKFEINSYLKIGLILLGLFLMLVFISDGMGSLGRILDNLFSFLIGDGKYILAFSLIAIAISSYIDNIKTRDLGLVLAALGLILIASSFFDSLSAYAGVYQNRFHIGRKITSINGGIIGGFLNSILLSLIGPVGIYIFLAVSFLIVFKILFDLDYLHVLEVFKTITAKLVDVIRNVFIRIKDKIETFAENRELKQNDQVSYTNIEPERKAEPKETKEPNIINSYEVFPDDRDPSYENKVYTEDKQDPIAQNNKDSIVDEIKDSPIDTYQAPSLSLLNKNTNKDTVDRNSILENSKTIEETMANFKIEAKVANVTAGPTVTRYELVPAPDVRLSKIVGLADNLAFSLASSDIRIEAPIPGKRAVGIEVPNEKNSLVSLEELLNSSDFKEYKGDLPLVLGRDVSGEIVIDSIEDMPHMLIAGSTGSGKSVCINSIILSLVYKSSPRDLRLILIDPKIVELSGYNVLPHLLIPVVTDPRKAASTLCWAVEEMERRYEKFSQSGVKDIKDYNKKFKNTDQALSKIVVIIDELADLMMVASNEVEDYISRLAQMARAAGIHLILATQRPSVDVITGTIKANIPSRISFAVSSAIDSRTILDESGAEGLLGKGDMLFFPSSYSKPRRIQGSFVSQDEIDRVLGYFKNMDYEDHGPSEEIQEEIENVVEDKKLELETDPLFKEALKLVVYDEQASISYVQRKLRVGYNRAARIIDQMEEQGFIGPSNGPKPRDIYITEDEYLQLLGED